MEILASDGTGEEKIRARRHRPLRLEHPAERSQDAVQARGALGPVGQL